MTIQEHLDYIYYDDEYDNLGDLMIGIIEQDKFENFDKIFAAYTEEISKDRKPFQIDDKVLKEMNDIKNLVNDKAKDAKTRKDAATAFFETLIFEKIKTHASKYEKPEELAEEMHKEYLKVLN